MHAARKISRALVAAALVAAMFASAAPAAAAVLDNDLIGTVRVGSSTERRSKAPDLYIPAGMLTTIDGRELWARDQERRRAMASTTKIMTAVVVLERADLDDTVTVSRNAATKVGESGMNLQPGEKLTVRQLLKGLLVQSGNDAAVALAEHVGGSVPGFVKLMNDKARALNLINTHFANPHGLDAKGHYTSAEDLTALARYAMRDPIFRGDVAEYRARVTGDRYSHDLVSHNALLKKYKGAEGIKTGWTDDAGYCIVAAAKRGRVELVGTVLGAASEASRLGQAYRLLNWGFKHYKMTTVVTAGEPLGRVRVSDWLDAAVPAVTAEATQVPVFDLAGPLKRNVELQSEVSAPVKTGQRLGVITVSQGGSLIAQVPLVAARDIAAPTWSQRVGIFFGRMWRGIFGS
jgi:serine-type D-Ala-D-Ala carboxypeptidase (penicillin-binding protein 5/6)